jgi:hypothetical protein
MTAAANADPIEPPAPVNNTVFPEAIAFNPFPKIVLLKNNRDILQHGNCMSEVVCSWTETKSQLQSAGRKYRMHEVAYQFGGSGATLT